MTTVPDRRRRRRTLAGTVVAAVVLGLGAAVVVAMDDAHGPVTDRQQLAQDIVDGGGLTDGTGAPLAATSATCLEVKVAPDGTGTYRCLVDFASGARQAFNVTVAPDGSWLTDAG